MGFVPVETGMKEEQKQTLWLAFSQLITEEERKKGINIKNNFYIWVEACFIANSCKCINYHLSLLKVKIKRLFSRNHTLITKYNEVRNFIKPYVPKLVKVVSTSEFDTNLYNDAQASDNYRKAKQLYPKN